MGWKEHPGLRAAIELAATMIGIEQMMVMAAGEARRLAAKYPESGMSEKEILSSIVSKVRARQHQMDALARLTESLRRSASMAADG